MPQSNPLERAQSKLSSLSRKPFSLEFSSFIAVPFEKCLGTGDDELKQRALNVKLRTDIIAQQIATLMRDTQAVLGEKAPRRKKAKTECKKDDRRACAKSFTEQQLALKMVHLQELQSGKSLVLQRPLDIDKAVGGRKRKSVEFHNVSLKTARRTLDSIMPELAAADATIFRFDKLRYLILPFELQDMTRGACDEPSTMEIEGQFEEEDQEVEEHLQHQHQPCQLHDELERHFLQQQVQEKQQAQEAQQQAHSQEQEAHYANSDADRDVDEIAQYGTIIVCGVCGEGNERKEPGSPCQLCGSALGYGGHTRLFTGRADDRAEGQAKAVSWDDGYQQDTKQGRKQSKHQEQSKHQDRHRPLPSTHLVKAKLQLCPLSPIARPSVGDHGDHDDVDTGGFGGGAAAAAAASADSADVDTSSAPDASRSRRDQLQHQAEERRRKRGNDGVGGNDTDDDVLPPPGDGDDDHTGEGGQGDGDEACTGLPRLLFGSAARKVRAQTMAKQVSVKGAKGTGRKGNQAKKGAAVRRNKLKNDVEDNRVPLTALRWTPPDVEGNGAGGADSAEGDASAGASEAIQKQFLRVNSCSAGDAAHCVMDNYGCYAFERPSCVDGFHALRRRLGMQRKQIQHYQQHKHPQLQLQQGSVPVVIEGTAGADDPFAEHGERPEERLGEKPHHRGDGDSDCSSGHGDGHGDGHERGIGSMHSSKRDRQYIQEAFRGSAGDLSGYNNYADYDECGGDAGSGDAGSGDSGIGDADDEMQPSSNALRSNVQMSRSRSFAEEQQQKAAQQKKRKGHR
jgi:hypothetical protein